MSGSHEKQLLTQATDFAINDSWEASHKIVQDLHSAKLIGFMLSFIRLRAMNSIVATGTRGRSSPSRFMMTQSKNSFS